jgi:hypothetical protein
MAGRRGALYRRRVQLFTRDRGDDERVHVNFEALRYNINFKWKYAFSKNPCNQQNQKQERISTHTY